MIDLNDVLERACGVYREALGRQHSARLGFHLPADCPGPREGDDSDQIDPGGTCEKCFTPKVWLDLDEEERERIRALLRPVVAVLVPGQTRGFVTLQADVLDEMVGTAIQREREECRRIASSYADEAERQAEHESERVFNGTGSWTHGDRRHNDGRRDVAEQIERRIRERSRA